MISRCPLVLSAIEETLYKVRVTTSEGDSALDTHQGPVFSVRVHSPTQGVIGVRIEHFKSESPYPNIPLFPDAEPIKDANLGQNGDTLTLSSGGNLTCLPSSTLCLTTFLQDLLPK